MLEKIVELLKNVPQSYDDFVRSMKSDLSKRPDLIPLVMDFILEDSSRSPSEILEYYWRLEKTEMFFDKSEGERLAV
ncbi:MAG: hypothetical protein IJ682_08670 [Lachnospiraceae bacterium]|nr:hypothetical protein [Lachnospiraceae bacterium]